MPDPVTYKIQLSRYDIWATGATVPGAIQLYAIIESAIVYIFNFKYKRDIPVFSNIVFGDFVLLR